MKVEIKENEAKALPEYPYLGIREDNGLIIFFTAPKTGIVVRGTDFNSLGQYLETWAESEYITPFNGTITLSND